MPRKNPEIQYIYLELLKENPVAYKRYLLFVHRKFWYSCNWFVTDGHKSTKNLNKGEGKDEN